MPAVGPDGTTTPDFQNPAARKYARQQLARLFRAGIIDSVSGTLAHYGGDPTAAWRALSSLTAGPHTGNTPGGNYGYDTGGPLTQGPQEHAIPSPVNPMPGMGRPDMPNPFAPRPEGPLPAMPIGGRTEGYPNPFAGPILDGGQWRGPMPPGMTDAGGQVYPPGHLTPLPNPRPGQPIGPPQHPQPGTLGPEHIAALAPILRRLLRPIRRPAQPLPTRRYL